MKALKIFLALFIAVMAYPAFSAENVKGEVLAVFRTPEGMTLTEESLRDGEIRKHIEDIAASVDARIVNIYDALSLANKAGKIIVMLNSETRSTDDLIVCLKANPDVLSVSPNRKVRLH